MECATEERAPQRILSRVEPLRLCSPRGYLCRVAFTYRYGTPMSLFKLAGIRGLLDLDLDDGAARISYALRLEAEEWGALHYSHVEVPHGFDKRLFCGQIVDAGRLNYGTPRVCPECLIENQVWWALWDLNYVCACPKHAARLVNTCSSCGRQLRWNRPAPHLCKCGYDLRGIRCVRASDVLVGFTAKLYDAAVSVWKRLHAAGVTPDDSIVQPLSQETTRHYQVD